ncbi:MAG TPA: tannase/feruloyl esterase family alpha/beta hydrolase [Phenylobacterium sp.]
MRKLLIAAGAVVALAAPGLARAEASCADLKNTKLAHAEITAVSKETSGSVELCKISVKSHPTKDSDIGIEVWIPIGAAWNGKFVQLGNGGFAGAIGSQQLKRVAGQGYATAGTDDGHTAPGTSAAWALGHPEKVVDFGWRALKETTDISKALIRAQKTTGPKNAYFMGCSDGGREALMEAQRYPNDFDGIVAGAPANYMSRLFALGAGNEQALAKPGGYLDAPALALLQKTALTDCAGGGNYIRDPLACRFDPGKLLCKPGQSDGCLSAGQVVTARTIYDGHRDPRTGKIVFPGFTPGAEAQQGGWTTWTTGPNQAANVQAASYQFSSNAFKYFAFEDPNYDFLKLDLGAEYDRAQKKMAAVIDSPNPNLGAFRKRGGKLIQYHGWNDPAIPARSSIRYYEDVRRTMGDTAGFYRMYLVPGMLHCGGGAGPSTIDWLSLLDKWVNEKAAPGELTATSVSNGSQRLCPYPGVASADGKSCVVKKKS